MANDVDLVVRRLRARREEIQEAILARVRDVVAAPAGDRDAEYVAGLRATVAAAIDFALTGIELGGQHPQAVPAEVIAQAQRAARNSVSLEAVLRRYMAGQALLWDYVMEEAARADQVTDVREMLRRHASLLDRLVTSVARAHVNELGRAGSSREQQLSERVHALLDGEHQREPGAEGGGVVGSGYELDAEHLGVIARGAGARAALTDLALELDRRLLCVAHGESTAWGWLGGQRKLEMAELERALSLPVRRPGERRDTVQGQRERAVSFAVGEPARDFEGWRLTHRQAQAALVVALRRPQRLTRYADVALLAAALTDEALARALRDTYLAPLEDPRAGGDVLRETLRAYLAVGRNASSAAAQLKVARSTVEYRLVTIGKRLARPLDDCTAELEIALRLDELGAPPARPSLLPRRFE